MVELARQKDLIRVVNKGVNVEQDCKDRKVDPAENPAIEVDLGTRVDIDLDKVGPIFDICVDPNEADKWERDMRM